MTDLAELPHMTTREVVRRGDAETAEGRSAHKATIVRRSTTLVARGEPVPNVQAPLVAAIPARSDDLLERAGQLAVLEEALASAGRDRRGAVVVVCGEAGVGKTALLRSFCDEVVRSQRVLWGTCDPLFTPRPFGPLFAIAEGTGGELGPALAQGANPHQVALALARELGSTAPTLLVLEDLHWADEATLDVFLLLVRRAEAAPALVVGTYRDDALENAHPLRRVLGELATTTAVRRLKLAPLSPDAVGQLAAAHGVDGRELYERTGGNPFFVVEVLAGGSEVIPPTVKDAVLSRAMRLSPSAQQLLEAAAVVPQRAELWLLQPWRAARWRPWTSASPPACSWQRATGSLSGTSSPASAWRARSAPPIKLACTVKPLAPSLVVRATLWTSLGWPTMPKRPGTPTLSSVSPSPRLSEQARWAPTARRRPSTGASSGSGPACRSNSAPTYLTTFTRVLPDRPKRRGDSRP